MKNTTVLETDTSSDQTVFVSRSLRAAVLDSGRIAFEYQSAGEVVHFSREKLEKHRFEAHEADYGRALLALGLTDP